MSGRSLIDYPIPIVDRVTFIYAEYGVLELDGHAVVLRQGDSKIHFPVGATSVICIEPGTVVTHAAVKACAESGCLLLWIGEAGVRCYSAGNPGGAVAQKLLHQASIHLDPSRRLEMARKIYREMFDVEPPAGRSIDQLRGIEGAKVYDLYREISARYHVKWVGRDQRSGLSDPLNRAISTANAALYGLVEAAILALGYSPAIGFIHSGDPRSFVFDIADTIKFKTIVPAAIELYSTNINVNESGIRVLCRDVFRRDNTASKIINIIEHLMRFDK